ncbi:hypothetical protein ACWD62_27730 [Streptomyces sp. NPDC005146]
MPSFRETAIASANCSSWTTRFPTAQPEQISPVYWELHTTGRDQAEHVFGLCRTALKTVLEQLDLLGKAGRPASVQDSRAYDLVRGWREAVCGGGRVLSRGRHGDELQLLYRHAYLVAEQVATPG